MDDESGDDDRDELRSGWGGDSRREWWGWRNESWSWFQRRCDAYLNERSVTCCMLRTFCGFAVDWLRTVSTTSRNPGSTASICYELVVELRTNPQHLGAVWISSTVFDLLWICCRPTFPVVVDLLWICWNCCTGFITNPQQNRISGVSILLSSAFVWQLCGCAQ